jgi:hypothetical protein
MGVPTLTKKKTRRMRRVDIDIESGRRNEVKAPSLG